MVESMVLAKFLLLKKVITFGGYGIATAYLLGTGVRYVKDYRTFLEEEEAKGGEV